VLPCQCMRGDGRCLKAGDGHLKPWRGLHRDRQKPLTPAQNLGSAEPKRPWMPAEKALMAGDHLAHPLLELSQADGEDFLVVERLRARHRQARRWGTIAGEGLVGTSRLL
jgi:hypothetical protein